MTTASPQVPLGSGFGAHSTAEEVLDGIDLTGRVALVTGGYSGIGLEVVRALAAAGAHVLAPARRPEKARTALADVDGVDVGDLDLADQASVATYAAEVLVRHDHLDLLIANAGVMACPEGGPATVGLQLATNHLGHFALVNRLWPALRGGARVVSVSSTGHHLSGMRWDDPDFHTGYDKWLAYGQSKTANVLFAVQLDALGREHGVRANALHPGAILTPSGGTSSPRTSRRCSPTAPTARRSCPTSSLPKRARRRRSGRRPHRCWPTAVASSSRTATSRSAPVSTPRARRAPRG